ncbi:hypothetical protein, variant [Verruconis gallopava]|uniref:ATP-dependent DNA helicase n=1 Tax=Verruconis gallopava TaxID=253628 RepID=A0A0D1XBI9_9PEZI|nr:hypothetical protein, variant [Verruconis gallopava]KIV99555.1 hypothetical protein, variant [Verruconis gallopava]
MKSKRKRSACDDEPGWDYSTASLPVKKQGVAPLAIDLTADLSSSSPEQLSRKLGPVPRRVDSGAVIPESTYTRRQHTPQDGLSALDAISEEVFDDDPSISFRRATHANKSKMKYYAVAEGRNSGIYTDWPSAEQQIRGYSGAVYKSFRTHEEAEDFINSHERVRTARHSNSFIEKYESRMESKQQNIFVRGARPAPQAVIKIRDEMIRDTGSNLYRSPNTPAESSSAFASATLAKASIHVSPAQMGGEVKTEPELCQEQRDLVNLILSGRNVFYTGSAGCGKSTVLKAFVKELKEIGRNVVIVAPTGKAALEINGSTYFTFAGWTPDHFKKPLKKLREGAHQKFVNKRMRAVDVLVIDEISMMENHAFERLNEVMKEARGSDKAFGGVQMVVTGDFCQLPPVKPFRNCIECGQDTRERDGGTVFTCPKHGDYLENDKWAFKSRAWTECNFAHVNLTTIHRQKDRKFIDILERCRMGRQLKQCERDLLLNHPSEVGQAVRLFSTREEVRQLNYKEYSKLQTEPRAFKCYDDIQVREAHPHLKFKATRLPDGSLAALKEQKFETHVELREGMRVVLQVNLNIDAGLVNGSQGIVIGWEPYDETKLPKADRSRIMSTPMNAIMGEHAAYREAHIQAFIDAAQVKEWPVVRFENGVERTIYAECIVSELGDTEPYTIMSRTQIPLLAGWAMTVHKAQGMTLMKVEVDLGKAFEEGQMYVALSRARSLDGLKVRSLGQWLGGGNDQVMQFLNEKFGPGA